MPTDDPASPTSAPSGARSAFVTGATGGLGLNLVEQLTRAGWEVFALTRASSDTRALATFGARRAIGDLLDEASLDRAIPPGVGVVFHTAADTSMWAGDRARQTRVNVDGTRNVLRAARRAGAGRVVHTSTWATFDLRHGDIDESTPQSAGWTRSGYAHSKLAAERVVRREIAAGLDAVILNPAHIVGRFDRHNWIRFIRHVATSTRPWVPPGFGSYCHAERVARAQIAAAERGRAGANYLLGGVDASFADLAQTIAEVLGRTVRPRVVPPRVLWAMAWVGAGASALTRRPPRLTPEGAEALSVRARVSSDRAACELDYEPGSLREMVEDACRWMREEALLSPG